MENERTGTVKNLQHFQLPDADNDHLLIRQTSSSKESRRLAVLNNNDVVLLVGDNLVDFSDLFYKKPGKDRLENTILIADEFGKNLL